MEDEAEKSWEKHMKECGSCRKKGKWNNCGGTTESYHAFIVGFNEGYKSLSTKKSSNSSSKKDCYNPICAKRSHECLSLEYSVCNRRKLERSPS